MVFGPINQVATPYSSIPNPKTVWEYKRPFKEEEVTNVASHKRHQLQKSNLKFLFKRIYNEIV